MSRGSVLRASPIRFCWSGGFFSRHCHISLALIVRIGPFVSASALRHVFSTNLPKINEQLINKIGVRVDSPPRPVKIPPVEQVIKGYGQDVLLNWGGKKRRRYRATARSSIWFAFPLQERNATLRRWPRGGRLRRVAAYLTVTPKNAEQTRAEMIEYITNMACVQSLLRITCPLLTIRPTAPCPCPADGNADTEVLNFLVGMLCLKDAA